MHLMATVDQTTDDHVGVAFGPADRWQERWREQADTQESSLVRGNGVLDTSGQLSARGILSDRVSTGHRDRRRARVCLSAVFFGR